MTEYQIPESLPNKDPVISTEEELNLHIRGCVENNRLSQKYIYYSYFGYALSICSRYTGNYEDALEIMNDGFLKIFKEIYRYSPAYTDSMSSFKGWLAKIMVYTAIDHYRRNRKHKVIQNLEDEVFRLAAENTDLLDSISYGEILNSLRRITPGYREILRLFIVEGFSHEEIANKLCISIGASKSGLSRGRKQLQNLLLNIDRV